MLLQKAKPLEIFLHIDFMMLHKKQDFMCIKVFLYCIKNIKIYAEGERYEEI